MQKLRIIFMGTAEFAVASLRALDASEHEIFTVVTGTDQPRGRGQKMTFTPVKNAAIDMRLPILQPSSLKDPSFAESVRALNPDLIVVVAFRILPPAVFEIPSKGSFNLHASLLPKYRGAAPINWAIINGETETGVTTFFLQSKVDTGAILLQRKLPIHPEDNAGTIHDKLAQLGAMTVVETADLIAHGKIETIRQDDAQATPAPKLFKESCMIDWTQPAEKIHNLIRGLSPYPGAQTRLNGTSYKILRSGLSDRTVSGLPGEITSANGSLEVACGNRSAIRIEELQPESKKRMTTSDFLRGYAVRKGDRFT